MAGFADFKYTDEDIVKALRRVARKLKRSPIASTTSSDNLAYDNHKRHGEPGTSIIIRRFGTWNNALAAAGLALNKQPTVGAVAKGFGKEHYTDAELLEAVRVAAERMRHGLLTVRAYDEVRRQGDPSGALIRLRLRDTIGGWSKIVAHVGGRAGTGKQVKRWRL